MKKKSSPPVFKEYTQGQIGLLPTDIATQRARRADVAVGLMENEGLCDLTLVII